MNEFSAITEELNLEKKIRDFSTIIINIYCEKEIEDFYAINDRYLVDRKKIFPALIAEDLIFSVISGKLIREAVRCACSKPPNGLFVFPWARIDEILGLDFLSESFSLSMLDTDSKTPTKFLF